jgi:hypothetical protein
MHTFTEPLLEEIRSTGQLLVPPWWILHEEPLVATFLEKTIYARRLITAGQPEIEFNLVEGTTETEVLRMR